MACLRTGLSALAAIALAGILVGVWPQEGKAADTATADLVDRSSLRVCADPANLPFSNEAGEGFENKIAELLAAELGVPVRYTWYPQSMGFVRQTLQARKCDLIMGVSLGYELLQNSNPYYRSTYALIYRPDSGIDAKDLSDPQLKDKSIGVVAGTPPASLIAQYGLLHSARPYHLMVDTRHERPGEQMAADVAAGEIDLGVLWGPIAGYYAQRQDPPLTVVPLKSEPDKTKMDYRITMGLRFHEPDWKLQINNLIRDKQPEINAILHSYGVPLLDEHGELIPASEIGEPPQVAEASGEMAVPEPEGYREEAYRAPVPATLEGATVVDTEEAKQLIDSGEAVPVDVMFRPPKPEGLTEGTIWRERPRYAIPGSLWLVNTGFGALAPEVEEYLQEGLAQASGGDKSKGLLFYCKAQCWMSWNAAKRAVSYGYSKVYWYPEGTDGWEEAGLPLEKTQPLPGAGALN